MMTRLHGKLFKKKDHTIPKAKRFTFHGHMDTINIFRFFRIELSRAHTGQKQFFKNGTNGAFSGSKTPQTKFIFSFLSDFILQIYYDELSSCHCSPFWLFSIGRSTTFLMSTAMLPIDKNQNNENSWPHKHSTKCFPLNFYTIILS